MIVRDARIAGKTAHAIAIFRIYTKPAVRLLDHFGLLRKGSVHLVGLRNGLRFQVRAGSGDLSIIDEVFIHRIYDRALSRIGPGHTVIDIGAHCGVFAVAAAARGAGVICIEPMVANLRALEQNIAANSLRGAVVVRPVAVGGTSGEIELYMRDIDSGGSTAFPVIHPEWVGRDDVKTVKVQCVTLEEVLKGVPGQCRCLKIDCEGAEYEIFAKASAEELGQVESIIMEYHPNGRVADVGERLELVGFRVEISPRSSTLFAWKD